MGRIEDIEPRRAAVEVEERPEQPAVAFVLAARDEHVLLRNAMRRVRPTVDGPSLRVHAHNSVQRPVPLRADAVERKDVTVVSGGSPRVDAGEFGGARRRVFDRCGTVGRQVYAPKAGMRGGEAPVTLHGGTEVPGDEVGIGRLAEIQTYRTVAFFPSVPVMEVKARGQFVLPREFQGVLLDHKHPRSEFGPPDVRVQKAHRAGREPTGIDDERRQQENEMPCGHDEVVHHAERRGRQMVEAGESAGGVYAVDEQGRPGRRRHTDVPHRAVRVPLRVGGEGEPRQVFAPVDEAA